MTCSKSYSLHLFLLCNAEPEREYSGLSKLIHSADVDHLLCARISTSGSSVPLLRVSGIGRHWLEMASQCCRCREKQSWRSVNRALSSLRIQEVEQFHPGVLQRHPFGRVGSWFFSQGLWQPQAQLPGSKYSTVLNQPGPNTLREMPETIPA